ncbi:MAG: TldD/PmbA family protein [Desulfurococcaceae archaeon]
MVKTLSKLEQLVRRAVTKGLAEVEVYAVHTISKQFSVASDMTIDSVVSEDYDIGLRGAFNKRIGGVRTNTLDGDVDKILEKLYSVTKSSPEDPYWSGFPVELRETKQVSCYDDKVAAMSEEELVEVLEQAMDAFKEPPLRSGAEKASVVEGSFSVRESRIVVINSHGVERSVRCSNVVLWLSLSTMKGGAIADKTFAYWKRKLDIKELEDKALRNGELALLFLNASPIESGNYDLVLVPETVGEILTYSLAPAFSALNILENRSPLKGRLGELVFNEDLTISDDPSIEMAAGTAPFDDEGVPTTTKPVVEKGVVKSILHSYYTARRMNTAPTGNGFRQYPAAPPTPRFTNMLVNPGQGSLEDFVRDISKGIVVHEIIGYWMSDPVTGSTKATVTHGLLVERGKVVKPVKGVVIGGNIYEWLSKGLLGVGKDLEIIGPAAAPSLWIKEVGIAGK